MEPLGLELVAVFSGFSLKSAMCSVSPASLGLPFQNPQLLGLDGVCLIFPHDFVTVYCMCICLLERDIFHTSGLLFVNKFLP